MDMTALYEEIKLKLQEIGLKVDEAQAGLEVEKQASYQKGYEDGKASVVLPEPGTGEKLFTQEDMDRVAEIAKQEKLMEIQPQLDQLTSDLAAAKAEIDVLKAELEAIKADVQNQVALGVDAGIAAFKAAVKAKYEEMQVVESQAETGFADFLK